MSAMSDLDLEVNEALDAYVAWMDLDMRYAFIDAVVPVLEKMTGRKVADEIASKKQRIAEAVRVYRNIQSEQNKKLEEISLAAEESGDYYDYDLTCYDTRQYLMDEGSRLAAQIEEILSD